MNDAPFRPLEVDVVDRNNCICEDTTGRASFLSAFECDSPNASHSNSTSSSTGNDRNFGINGAQTRGKVYSLSEHLPPGCLLNGQAVLPVQTPLLGRDSIPATPQRSVQTKEPDTCFCGPGRKRYVIAFLCCACLTIVIGMRSEMLGIITNLNNTNSANVPLPHFDGDLVEKELFANEPTSLTRFRLADSSAKVATSHSDESLHNEDGLHIVAGLGNSLKRQPASLIFKPSEHRQMPWTTTIKNDIVENAVFFAYLITSPIGGYLTVNHDSSFLLGCSVAMTCGMNLFLPLVETIGSNVNAKFIMVVLLRILQGLAEGCLIPAVFGVLRFWAPEAERSTLVCVAVIGVSLGPLIGLPVCAEIEKKWGWGVVFYIYANLGLIWCIFWWRLIDEKPARDEKLGKRERAYLHSNISSRVLNSTRQTSIPWQAIFRSRPIFAIFVTYAADDWTFQISSVCMQSFYQQIYHVDVGKTIFLLSFPFLSRSIFVPIGGVFADFLRNRTSLSQTTIRKLFAGLGFGLKGVFFIALGFAPTELYATVLLSLSLGFSGLAVAGYAVNVIDLAPNFSGLVMGFANSVSTFTGILSTLIATVVVHKFGLEIHNGWRVALGLAALSQFCAVVFYLLFASGEEQPWAYADNNLQSENVNASRDRVELLEANI